MAILSTILHILFFLLKILLILLGIVLALLLLVLILPIVYRAELVNEPGIFRAQGSVSWFFRLIYVKAGFTAGKLQYELYLFGIPVFRFLRRRRKKEEAKEANGESVASEEKTPGTGDAGKSPEEKPSVAGDAGKASEEKPKVVEKKSPEGSAGLASKKETEQEKAEKTEAALIKDSGSSRAEKKEKSDADKSKVKADKKEEAKTERKEKAQPEREKESIPEKIDDLLTGLGDKTSAILEKIEKTVDKITGLWDRVTDETTMAAMGFVWHQIIKILQSLLPRKLRGHIDYALGDAANTGRALGYYYSFSSLCPNDLNVNPDFGIDDWKLDTEVKCKGHIILGVILIRGLIVILNKDVRDTIRLFRHKKPA